MPPVGGTLPTNLVRVEARVQLLRLIAARIADEPTLAHLRGEDGCAVLYRYDSKHPGRMVICGDDVEGEVEITGFRGRARQARRDSFDLKLFAGVGPGAAVLDQSDPLDPAGFRTMDALVLELVQVIDDVVAISPRLGAEADSALAAALGSVEAQLTAIEGPNGAETNEGPGSGAIVTVHLETHHR